MLLSDILCSIEINWMLFILLASVYSFGAGSSQRSHFCVCFLQKIKFSWRFVFEAIARLRQWLVGTIPHFMRECVVSELIEQFIDIHLVRGSTYYGCWRWGIINYSHLIRWQRVERTHRKCANASHLAQVKHLCNTELPILVLGVSGCVSGVLCHLDFSCTG